MTLPEDVSPAGKIWSEVAYLCSYDEHLLGTLIESMLGHGGSKEDALGALDSAGKIADERDCDSMRADSLGLIERRLRSGKDLT